MSKTIAQELDRQASQSGNSDPQKRPLCVFAIRNQILQKSIQADFEESGIEPIFVNDEKEFHAYQGRPENFINFLDLRSFPQGIHWFQSRDTKVSKSAWVALTHKATTSQIRRLFNMGFLDVLNMPVHPVAFKSRARLFLSRFIRSPDFPVDVVIPTGMKRLAQGLARSSESPSEDKVTHRVHDLTPEQMQSAWNSHVSKDTEVQNSVNAWISLCSNPALSPLNTGVFGTKRVNAERLKFHKAACENLAKQPFLFVPIEKDREKYFKEAVMVSASTVVWTSNGWQDKVQVVSCDLQESNVRFSYPENMTPEKFADCINTADNEQVFTSMFLQRARVFFSQNIQDYNYFHHEFTVVVPQLVYLVQRRGSFRLPLDKKTDMRFQLKIDSGTEVEATPANISSTGAFLKMPSEIAEKLKNPKSELNLSFEIYGKKIECGARVIRVSASPITGFSNVGVHFSNMEPSDQDGLKLFVMEESYSYTSRFT